MLNVQTVQIINVREWNTFVEKIYNRPYNFQQQNGCRDRGLFGIVIPNRDEDYENNSIPDELYGEKKGVSFSAWLARNPEEWSGDPKDKHNLESFWHCNFYPDIQMIANDLYAKGLIPAGDYSIKIDW